MIFTLRVKSPCSPQTEGLGIKKLVEDSAVKPNVGVTLKELLLIEAEDGTAIIDIVVLRTGGVILLDIVLDGIAEAADVKFEELVERDSSATDVIVSTGVKSVPVGSSIDANRVEFMLEVEGKDAEPLAISTVGYSKETDGLTGYAYFVVVVRLKSDEVAPDTANPEGRPENSEVEALKEDVHEVEEAEDINPSKVVAL